MLVTVWVNADPPIEFYKSHIWNNCKFPANTLIKIQFSNLECHYIQIGPEDVLSLGNNETILSYEEYNELMKPLRYNKEVLKLIE